MEALELHILPESPTIVRDKNGDMVAAFSVFGNAKELITVSKQISKAINCYTSILEKLILLYAELDREEIENAKRLAAEAYNDAINGNTIKKEECVKV